MERCRFTNRLNIRFDAKDNVWPTERDHRSVHFPLTHIRMHFAFNQALNIFSHLKLSESHQAVATCLLEAVYRSKLETEAPLTAFFHKICRTKQTSKKTVRVRINLPFPFPIPTYRARVSQPILLLVLSLWLNPTHFPSMFHRLLLR